MIPEDYIREWQVEAPWSFLYQVEQDLIISRALVALYNNPVIQNTLAFRGGTALHKLFINPAGRYSEDLDFVQIKKEPIGETFRGIQSALDHWLGKPSWEKKQGRVTLRYRFIPENQSFPMKLKIEINTAEHFSIEGFKEVDYTVNSRWFQGHAKIVTFSLDELVGTKLRALYQRRKGRDLFDLWLVLQNNMCDIRRAVSFFKTYLDYDGLKITRAQFEKNLFSKFEDRSFKEDIIPLLSPQIEWNFEGAKRMIEDCVFPCIEGDPWKGSKD